MESVLKVRKILVPVDYSECSKQAARYALKIAQPAKAEVLFFHAFYSPAFDLIELTGNKNSQKKLRAEVTQKLMETESETMSDFIQSISETKDGLAIDKQLIETEIRPGLAKDEIARISSEYKPGLVIMGSSGKNRRESSVLGSITEIAIKRLKFPVLAVPEHYKFIGRKNLTKILFLTDYDESDFLSIKKLMGFATLLNLSIHCLHIGNKTGNWEKLKMDGLKSYFRSTYEKVQVECEILHQTDSILNATDNYIKENNINIISLTTRKRTVFEKLFKPSFAKKLFYHTNIPLLVFHS